MLNLPPENIYAHTKKLVYILSVIEKHARRLSQPDNTLWFLPNILLLSSRTGNSTKILWRSKKQINQNHNQAKSAAKKVWGITPTAGSSFTGGFKPGTREFFEKVLKKGALYELPQFFELTDFPAYKGKRVLTLGCEAGKFCRNGSEYTGIDLVPENIARTKKHLSFYGLKTVVLEGDAENLVFNDESFDQIGKIFG